MTLRQSILALILAVAIAPSALARQHGGHQHDTGPFRQMQQMMDRADKTTDPAERCKLMHEHMEAMHKQTQSMHGIMGVPEGDTMQEKMQNRHQRMDMMQMMMEQMMSQHRMMMDMPDEESGKKDESGNE